MKNNILLKVLNTCLLEKEAMFEAGQVPIQTPPQDIRVYDAGIRKGFPLVDPFGNKLGTPSYVNPENVWIENFYRTFEQLARNQRVEEGGAYATFTHDPSEFKGLAARLSNPLLEENSQSAQDRFLRDTGIQSVLTGVPHDAALGSGPCDGFKKEQTAYGGIRAVVQNVPLQTLMADKESQNKSGRRDTTSVNTKAGFDKLFNSPNMRYDPAASNSDGSLSIYTSHEVGPRNIPMYDWHKQYLQSVKDRNKEIAKKRRKIEAERNAASRTWYDYLFNNGVRQPRDFKASDGSYVTAASGQKEVNLGPETAASGQTDGNNKAVIDFTTTKYYDKDGKPLEYKRPLDYTNPKEREELKKRVEEYANNETARRHERYKELHGKDPYIRKVTQDPKTNTKYNHFQDMWHDWWNG